MYKIVYILTCLIVLFKTSQSENRNTTAPKEALFKTIAPTVTKREKRVRYLLCAKYVTTATKRAIMPTCPR